jgi:hypothetical protein
VALLRILAGAFLIALIPSASSASADRFEIVIEDSLYPQIEAAIDRYAEDVEAQGYDVTVTLWTGGSAADLRAHLRTSWQNDNLVGAVMIGALPIAQFESEWVTRRGDPPPNGFGTPRAASFPVDLYFMDLDGDWRDTDNNGFYDVHENGSGDVTPEIWVGRIWTSTLGDEAQIVDTYLARVHEYKAGRLPLEDRGLLYSDDDWSGYWADVWTEEMRQAFPDTLKVDDPWTTWRDDWLDHITQVQGWTWAHLCSHSWPQGHGFKRSEDWSWVYSTEIPGINPRVHFFDCFDCSFGRYIESDYGAGAYVFLTDWGLGGIASTKTGGLWNAQVFYWVLGQGGCMGEAFKSWWEAIGADGYDAGEICWWYGLTNLGDPTLCPAPQEERAECPAGRMPPGWSWVSIPLVPVDDEVDSVFAGYGVRNRLFRWNAETKVMELYPDDFDTVQLARGYLLWSGAEIRPSYEGWALPVNGEAFLPQAGWTWIGHPFAYPVALADTWVRDGLTGEVRGAWADWTAPDPWISWFIIYWDTSERQMKMLSLDASGDDDMLRPWNGYCVWANRPDMVLVVPR